MSYPSTTDADADVAAFISRVRRERDVPGLAVGWSHHSEARIHTEGVASLLTNNRVTPSTLFQIGSIGKTLTATVVMHLVEEGLLDLDGAVVNYIPELQLADQAVQAALTPRHLLTHVGGWAGDLYKQTGSGEDALTKILNELKTLPQQSPLGSVWSYNNAGFYILGALIERLLETSYERAIYEIICRPLGIECYFFADEVITKNFAVGHAHSRAGIQITTPWSMPRSSNPLGGMLMNIDGLLEYGMFHLSDLQRQGQPITPESRRRMREPQIEAGNGFTAQGLGWQLKVIDGVTVATHAGSANGMPSLLSIVPEYGYAIAALANADTGAGAEREIVKHALAVHCGLVEPTLVPDEKFLVRPEEWVGRYSNLESHFDLKAVDGMPSLIQRTHHEWLDDMDPPSEDGDPVAFGFYGPDKLVGLEGGYAGRTAEFLRDSEGIIQWFRIQSRAAARSQQI